MCACLYGPASATPIAFRRPDGGDAAADPPKQRSRIYGATRHIKAIGLGERRHSSSRGGPIAHTDNIQSSVL